MLIQVRVYCVEGACSRWSAKRSQDFGAATQPSGSKLPRHKSQLPHLIGVSQVFQLAFNTAFTAATERSTSASVIAVNIGNDTIKRPTFSATGNMPSLNPCAR